MGFYPVMVVVLVVFFLLVDVGGSVLRTRASFFAGCLGPDVSLKASA